MRDRSQWIIKVKNGTEQDAGAFVVKLWESVVDVYWFCTERAMTKPNSILSSFPLPSRAIRAVVHSYLASRCLFQILLRLWKLCHGSGSLSCASIHRSWQARLSQRDELICSTTTTNVRPIQSRSLTHRCVCNYPHPLSKQMIA